MQSWTREDAVHVYNIEQWGEGYFDVDADGYVLVRPDGTEGMSEEQLADLVTRESMIGTGLPRRPEELAR